MSLEEELQHSLLYVIDVQCEPKLPLLNYTDVLFSLFSLAGNKYELTHLEARKYNLVQIIYSLQNYFGQGEDRILSHFQSRQLWIGRGRWKRSVEPSSGSSTLRYFHPEMIPGLPFYTGDLRVCILPRTEGLSYMRLSFLMKLGKY